VLTDLVGSTELWDSDPVAMAEALERHDALVTRVVDEAGGELIRSKGEGDSTFSVFADPLRATRAAFGIVRSMDAIEWPTEAALTMRLGVHVGPAQHRGGDWFGSTVNRTARLRGLAPAGAILMSGVAARSVGDALAPAARPEFVGWRHLRGLRDPEEVWALVAEGSQPPQVPPDVGDTNIDRPERVLFGRSTETEAVEQLLRRHRLVTITGAGGVGKTRLAVDVALEVREAYRDGVWLADLSGTGPGGVLSVVLSRCGGPTIVAVEELVGRECLVVMDNCEHVLADAATTAALVLRAAPSVRVLATSRHRLGLAAEVVYPVEPLPVPSGGADLADVERFASFALFLERAQAIDPRFVLGPSDTGAVVRCLRAVEGVPLAIEIAASRTRSMPVTRLCASLERTLPDVPSAGRDVAERHRSVAATIEWSLALLEPGDVAALEEISVCRGFDRDTAQAVINAVPVDDFLEHLVDASLVTPLGGDRFRLLEPVRQHMASRLAGRDGVDDSLLRLSGYISRLGYNVGLLVYVDSTARIRLRGEAGNIEQVLTWLMASGRTSEAVRLVGALGAFWFTDDQATGRRWTEQITPFLDGCTPRESAMARVAVATHRQGSGEACAIGQLTIALTALEEAGSLIGAAYAAVLLAREHGIDEARPPGPTVAAIERAVDLASRADEPNLIGWSLSLRAIGAERQGDVATAERDFARVLEICTARGAVHPVGEALSGLAQLAYRSGDLRRARHLAERAVAFNRRSGDDWQLTHQLRLSMEFAVVDADLTQAAIDASEAAVLALRIGDEYQTAEVLAVAALVLDGVGEHVAAASCGETLRQWATVHPLNRVNPILNTLARLTPAPAPGFPALDQRTIREQLEAVQRHFNAPHR
jgi:predicted ATPase/class 3 adenylate cyclase